MTGPTITCSAFAVEGFRAYPKPSTLNLTLRVQAPEGDVTGAQKCSHTGAFPDPWEDPKLKNIKP